MKRILYLLSFALIHISCKKAADETSYEADRTAVTEEAFAPAQPVEAAAEVSNVSNNDVSLIDQKIIKNGTLRFETADMNKTAAKIYAALKGANGYIQLDNETKGYNEITRNIVIRVPNQNFEKLLSEVTQGITYFDEKQITSEDVTEQFIDLEAQLKSKKE